MCFRSNVSRCAGSLMLFGALFIASQLRAQSNLTIRVMAANITSSNLQSYEAEGIRIFQGLKPDIVAIQEFQYGGSTASNDLRTLVNTAFGSEFSFYCEPNNGIPNGIVSRWPILDSGSWPDPFVSDRDFAWAQIDLPGTNDLYVVSVHLYGSGSESDRGVEANIVKDCIQTNFPANAWVVVGGDFNAVNRGETCVDNFKTILSDSPIPSDRESGGDEDTNANRNKPYDYVLPSFAFTNRQVPVVIGANTFPKGLVFDSSDYNNNYTLSDVFPVQSGDSHVPNMQHMAVIKDFVISTNSTPVTNPPAITSQPQSQTNSVGANVTFTVTATGTAPLAYQWRVNTTNITGATTNSYTLNGVQATNAGVYSVVVTNLAGSVTSSNATLTVISAPNIATQPQSQSASVGQGVTFFVVATGDAPLNHQWRFYGSNIAGATGTNFILSPTQTTNAGDYTVVVTNNAGSITSSVAVLTVNAAPTGNVIAQWNFNSINPDGTNNTGTTTPSIGTGTASLVTALTPTFAGGSTTDPASATPDNSGWNTTGYPASTGGNKTAGVRFDVSTVGKQNLSVRWDQRVSNTGSKYSRLQYTTNGTAFLDFPTSVAVVTATVFEPHTNNLGSLPGVNNNPLFGFRFVNEFEFTATGSGASAYAPALSTSTYAGSGTTRFDMVTLFGDPLTVSNAPASAPTLTNAAFVSSQFQFLLTGTAGSNYIVQASTNLSNTNWISLRTNTAPFSFTDSNANAFPERYYRGLVAP